MNVTEALHHALHGGDTCLYEGVTGCAYLRQAALMKPLLIADFKRQLNESPEPPDEAHRLRMHLASEHGTWYNVYSLAALERAHDNQHAHFHVSHRESSRAWDPEITDAMRPKEA